MKVAVVANTTWYIYNFRRSLMSALSEAGYDVTSIAGADAYVDKLRSQGFSHCKLPVLDARMSPWRDLLVLLELRRVLRRERVGIALTYTPKATIYTALAAFGQPTRIVVNISGLGRAFVGAGWLRLAMQMLYRGTLRRASFVFFQNRDDHAYFVQNGLVDAERTGRVPGSGVDLSRFVPPAPTTRDADAPVRFLMVARLIWEKGLAEFIDAARRVKGSSPAPHFTLLGGLDSTPRRGASKQMLQAWIDEGLVEYAGTTDDVRPFLAQADCVVLPSFREGVPRSLLEAAAMARPIIATDVAGCREVVDNNVNGYLCRERDGADLATKMLQFIALSAQQRDDMGRNSRLKVEREFDEREVIGAYLRKVAQIVDLDR